MTRPFDQWSSWGPALTRRSVIMLGAAALYGPSSAGKGLSATAQVNSPRTYPVQIFGRPLQCVVDPSQDLGPVDHRIFGTNLEWFNDAGGLASANVNSRARFTDLAREQSLSVLRFPGGILADFYNWRDGTGPVENRPVVRHPTDPGRSANNFGSPEFFAFLRKTGAKGLITVNAGTSTPEDAAAWVRYANAPESLERRADGQPEPAGIKLWEVGNELYLPDNAGPIKIGKTPEQYAARFIKFADAMRAADPSITVIAIGVAESGIGPSSPYQDWTEKLLRSAASKIDMIAVHNAYFPLLYFVQQPAVDAVYPALWAAPEAVDRSLTKLSKLIARYEGDRSIGIALTEWGALFSLPLADNYWFDHVKTLGAGIYIGRLLQVLIGQRRVTLANYFKFVDRSFMGWVAFNGVPKAPYWVFRLYAESTGERRIAASLDSPTYDTPALGAMAAETGVAEVTVVGTQGAAGKTLFVNFVNRSLVWAHNVQLDLRGNFSVANSEIRSISANEPTAHNGVDIPPEWPMKPEYEPYTTAKPGSIGIVSRNWSPGDPIFLPPFSVATLILRSTGSHS